MEIINKRKPRILMIAPLPPPVHGSSMVSQSIRDSRMLNETFRMDFVNLSTSRTMEEIDKRSKILYVKKAIRFMGAYAQTFWNLATRRYDLCYLAITCHGVGFLKDAPFVLLCKLFGKKVVIHQHNKGMAKDVDKAVYKWLFHQVYKNSKIILLSWHLYEDIARVVAKSNVMVCHNGIEPTVEWPFEKYENEKPHILFLSNLIIEKGVLVLLDALKILKGKELGFICDFVGSETKDMDAVRFAKEAKERGLDDVAIYHGRKYGKEKKKYFHQADIFAFPTFYFNECFPLVNLEAMEYGLPVISTNEGGIPDEIINGKNGFVVEAENAEMLAGSIEKLIIDKPLRKTMGEEGRKMFIKRFTINEFEISMKNCLWKCIQEK